ncbi:23S rRNA (adenine2030-N6)-methyltransferase [Roseivivax lentus]|uniref:Ribosomal RNA large subunit methyltransferase J n=1 Tax=Roseivivax lentus TaxID=633194 RepID=A0A1N7L281_9RHOB|nr:23S rRNA (adenine(2030)-N(6))-methyltransferase RlmJ [Roseivivax lentus]SIS67924.1 23S rRNA (adenine2030-N6)-methyltransferase [Roseivivax lentus]
MLSYQHAYHAGNAADLHKHGLLAWMLDYLTRKDKPLSYIETHAGRGLYDLDSAEAQKTGEAAAGVDRIALPEGHPLTRALGAVRAAHGPRAYPGSPLIAEALLRGSDSLHLAELHPGEYAALTRSVTRAQTYRQDGFALAHSLVPPEPRRGLLLCDPSYEVKADYAAIPQHFTKLARAWNVGILVLWYPILRDARHRPMLAALQERFPDALTSELRFPPAREGHGMTGSGMFVVSPPWGLAEAARDLSALIGGD